MAVLLRLAMTPERKMSPTSAALCAMTGRALKNTCVATHQWRNFPLRHCRSSKTTIYFLSSSTSSRWQYGNTNNGKRGRRHPLVLELGTSHGHTIVVGDAVTKGYRSTLTSAGSPLENLGLLHSHSIPSHFVPRKCRHRLKL